VEGKGRKQGRRVAKWDGANLLGCRCCSKNRTRNLMNDTVRASKEPRQHTENTRNLLCCHRESRSCVALLCKARSRQSDSEEKTIFDRPRTMRRPSVLPWLPSEAGLWLCVARCGASHERFSSCCMHARLQPWKKNTGCKSLQLESL
jgi:hypothetical protein